MEDLDNCNRRNNIMVSGLPETVTDLSTAIKKLFHSMLPDQPEAFFISDRIHRALGPKPLPENPLRDSDVPDFLVKEEVLRASHNTPRIQLDGVTILRRQMKEVTTVLQSARICYRWGFPFKLLIPTTAPPLQPPWLLKARIS